MLKNPCKKLLSWTYVDSQDKSPINCRSSLPSPAAPSSRVLRIEQQEARGIPRNRLSPRYINIAITRYNKLAGAAAQPSPKGKEREIKEKQMSTSVDQRNKDDPPPLRPPENSHHAPSTSKHRVPSNTFKKESDDDDAAARTSPRVSPDTQRGVGKG
jgi:hypothetical protein